MVLHLIRICRQCELFMMILLYAIVSSSGMSITGVTTDLPPTGSTSTDQPLTSSELPSSITKTATTNQSADDSFPKLAGSVVMIFVAVLGSVIASWFARKICPDSWTGKYCHSCRDYVSSMQSQKRRKSAIVLPVDEDSGSVIRWTDNNDGPLASVQDHQKMPDPPSRVPVVSTNGPSKGSSGDAKKPSGSTKPRGKPSFMTIGALVTTFTVPKSDLTEIALEQLQKEIKTKDKTKKKSDKPTSAGGSKPNDLKSDTSSSEQFDDETNSKEMLITDSPETVQEEKATHAEVKTGETNQRESENSQGRRKMSLRKQDSGEIIHLREITKSVSPSQKSEAYSSDFESMTTARTVESLHRMNESPIRTIHEDFKT